MELTSGTSSERWATLGGDEANESKGTKSEGFAEEHGV